LGQRLVIPVGQTWPWLPADQIHLRRPLIEPGEQSVIVRSNPGLLGLRRHYRIALPIAGEPPLRVYAHRGGYQWQWERATWVLRPVRAPSGVLRAVLMRNRQPIAALQSQGRLLNRWTEFIYDDRGYRLLPTKDQPGQGRAGGRAHDARRPARYMLLDRDQETLLTIEQGELFQARLCRALPLPLLIAALVQTIDQEPLQITRKRELE
jgi:hypothetical protein